MALIAKEQDTLSSVLASAGATPPVAAKPQPAAVEIPVTVNGARTVEGSEKREPFSENTQTVLVFANGAVIRLASGVASGQLLFLTNDRTKKEVVCQVVKSKNYSRENGYVELEFTEAAPGFWGMRFASAGAAGTVAAAPVAAKMVSTVSTTPEKSLQEKLGEEKAKTQAVAAVEPGKPTEGKPVEMAGRLKEPETPPVAAAEESIVPPAVAAPPLRSLQERLIEATTKAEILPRTENPRPTGIKTIALVEPAEGALKIPTLSEFLTNGARGPELRAGEKEESATPEQKANENAKSLTEEVGGPQGQLTTLIFEKKAEPPVEKKPNIETDSNGGLLTKMLVPEKKEVKSSASAPLPVKANPAPGTSTFDFDAEEVKIPAWLEPLAKNSPASAAIFEAKMPEIKSSEIKLGETFAASSAGNGQSEHGSSTEENSTEYSEKHEAVLTLSSEGPTPNFGSSLAFDAKKTKHESASGGSRKGLVLGLLAAVLLVAAGGGWYWYTNQPRNVAASGSGVAPENAAIATAQSEAAPVSRSAASSSTNFAANAAGNYNTVNPTATRNDSNRSASSVEPPLGTSSSAPEPVAKPKLGKVHLSAPVVNRKLSGTDNTATVSAPALNDGGVTGGDPGTLGLLANKAKQPAAPLPVGGDVKQARLISSVPPMYPQLARSQRLSGDVVVDALVDVHGNVATMKVVSGPAMLHQAAMDALRQWKYQPATLNGQPTPMHLAVTVQFRLP